MRTNIHNFKAYLTIRRYFDLIVSMATTPNYFAKIKFYLNISATMSIIQRSIFANISIFNRITYNIHLIKRIKSHTIQIKSMVITPLFNFIEKFSGNIKIYVTLVKILPTIERIKSSQIDIPQITLIPAPIVAAFNPLSDVDGLTLGAMDTESLQYWDYEY